VTAVDEAGSVSVEDEVDLATAEDEEGPVTVDEEGPVTVDEEDSEDEVSLEWISVICNILSERCETSVVILR